MRLPRRRLICRLDSVAWGVAELVCSHITAKGDESKRLHSRYEHGRVEQKEGCLTRRAWSAPSTWHRLQVDCIRRTSPVTMHALIACPACLVCLPVLLALLACFHFRLRALPRRQCPLVVLHPTVLTSGLFFLCESARIVAVRPESARRKMRSASVFHSKKFHSKAFHSKGGLHACGVQKCQTMDGFVGAWRCGLGLYRKDMPANWPSTHCAGLVVEMLHSSSSGPYTSCGWLLAVHPLRLRNDGNAVLALLAGATKRVSSSGPHTS